MDDTDIERQVQVPLSRYPYPRWLVPIFFPVLGTSRAHRRRQREAIVQAHGELDGHHRHKHSQRQQQQQPVHVARG